MGVHFLLKPAVGKALSPLPTVKGNHAKAAILKTGRSLVLWQSQFAAVLTLALLIFLTYVLHNLQISIPGSSPYLSLYLIPVAYAGAFLGCRGAYMASAIALLLAFYYLFPHQPHSLAFPSTDDGLRFAALAFIVLILATVTGQLRDALQELRESEDRRLSFNREVLLAVTNGRLLLCDREELPAFLKENPAKVLELRTSADVPNVRHILLQCVKQQQLSFPRLDDFCTCVTEALTNALKYGKGGVVRLWVGGDQISVLVSDKGPGISPTNLARATLECGFSTRQTLGMGFTMMLATADRIVLSTSEAGTDILLQVGSQPLATLEDYLLARC